MALAPVRVEERQDRTSYSRARRVSVLDLSSGEEMTDTTLPELPEWLRWNVVAVLDYDYIPARTVYQVRLEMKKWWGWSWIDRLSVGVLSDENILNAANQLVSRREERTQSAQREQKYLGTYPPKTLG